MDYYMKEKLKALSIVLHGNIKNEYKVVVPLSGGKDSQACLYLALQEYKPDEILCLFCDTQYEHPLTYSHIKKITEKYNVNLVKLTSGNVLQVCTKYKRFQVAGLGIVPMS